MAKHDYEVAPDRTKKGSSMIAELAPPVSQIGSVVDAWFIETFHNRGLHVDEFNRLQAAKKTLKDALQRIP
jgi:hypothetical protein